MDSHIAYFITDVSRLVRKRFDTIVAELGITGPQGRILFLLARTPGSSQGALAEQLDVEPITVCRMVDRLEQAGLVERRRDPNDRRAWQIFLTGLAEGVVDRLHLLKEQMLAEIVEGLDDDAQAQLSRALGHIRDNMTARLNTDSPRLEGVN